ncbi:MAG: hypothetical protein OEW83_04905, partial [Acidimicrobiia bacterium]|nr:hypothetical protein [Acidimicrobiia bacterium]
MEEIESKEGAASRLSFGYQSTQSEANLPDPSGGGPRFCDDPVGPNPILGPIGGFGPVVLALSRCAATPRNTSTFHQVEIDRVQPIDGRIEQERK